MEIRLCGVRVSVHLHRESGGGLPSRLGHPGHGPVKPSALCMSPISSLWLEPNTSVEWQDLCEAGEAVFPLAPLVRAVVEHSNRAMWLLDPEVSSRQRLARTWLEELEGGRQAKLTGSRLGGLGSHVWPNAYEEQKRVVRNLFNPDEIQESKGSVLVLAGQKRPTAQKALGRASEIAGNTKTFGALDYLANASHPTVWAIGDLLVEQTDEHGQTTLCAGIDDLSYLDRLVGAAVVSLFNVGRVMQGYLGWPEYRLEGWFEAMGGVLPEVAPWEKGTEPVTTTGAIAFVEHTIQPSETCRSHVEPGKQGDVMT